MNSIDRSVFSRLCVCVCVRSTQGTCCVHKSMSLSLYLCFSLSLSVSLRSRTASLAVGAQSAARWSPGAEALCLNYPPNESLGESLGLLVPPSSLLSLSHTYCIHFIPFDLYANYSFTHTLAFGRIHLMTAVVLSLSLTCIYLFSCLFGPSDVHTEPRTQSVKHWQNGSSADSLPSCSFSDHLQCFKTASLQCSTTLSVSVVRQHEEA